MSDVSRIHGPAFPQPITRGRPPGGSSRGQDFEEQLEGDPREPRDESEPHASTEMLGRLPVLPREEGELGSELDVTA